MTERELSERRGVGALVIKGGQGGGGISDLMEASGTARMVRFLLSEVDSPGSLWTAVPQRGPIDARKEALCLLRGECAERKQNRISRVVGSCGSERWWVCSS